MGSSIGRSVSVACGVSWGGEALVWSSFEVDFLDIVVISMVVGGVVYSFRSECRRLAMMLIRVSGVSVQWRMRTLKDKFSVSFARVVAVVG